ncbi:MAG: eryA [Tardiphaga sp.]|uniref:type I polyketide synthase n=1 Tax=Tardiphaga sp. TaxID=1926292 RepID=UPI00261D3413|nr:type I polyketide synthase [Tardiphaga sp.]MDB5502867.1 eryA [Tardiphaga sp.]
MVEALATEASATRPSAAPEPIAIIGIGCRFPGGADSPETFWALLREGIDAVGEIPGDRWDVRTYYDPDPRKPGKMNTRWGGFLEQIDKFDALFFGISPREAALMDPQQRLLMELAWEALEHAGQPAARLAGSGTGVFVGISSHDYGDIQMGDRANGDYDHYLMTGSALSIAANRLSYFFDFQGPSLAVDTACSSALTATHLACRSLWSGESSLALAGGVNIILEPVTSIGFSKASMLSPDGRCKAFDARANGYVRSEGGGVVVLKPLSKAMADGDTVIATIVGTAANQDGHSQGMTVPSYAAQSALLAAAYRQAGIAPHLVPYVEAHGTGTPVGDPIEASALGSVLSEGRAADRFCRIGSVKTNIGHLEAASGIAGLIKAALALQHREIPRNLHFEQPNPKIPFKDLKLRVQQIHEPWPAGEATIAGVNSFGFGGANAHVVLRAAEPSMASSLPASQLEADRACLFPLSGRSPEALNACLSGLRKFIDPVNSPHSAASLHDLCYTASTCRQHHDIRHALTVQSKDELLQQLDALLSRQALPAVAARSAASRPKIAFVFSGMGSQWWGMGRQLLAEEPIFRAAIARCDELFEPLSGWSLLSEFQAPEAASRMADADVAQPAGFALQVGLALLWRSRGIEPDFIVGHSAGEIAAAHVAGALGLDDAIRVVFHRSRLQHRMTGQGRMLAVALPYDEAAQMLHAVEDRVSIAAINSGRSITLAGDAATLARIEQSLTARRVFCRFLNVGVPYHSHFMDALRDELLESLHSIRPAVASLPIVLTVTGELAGNSAFDADYWWHNVRDPVLFASAIDGLIAQGCETFVELSAHPVLTGAIAENLVARGVRAGTVLPSLRRDDDDRATMLASLGALYTQGAAVHWHALYPDGGRRVPLPATPWLRERHWTESRDAQQQRLGRYQHPLLGRRLNTANPTWQATLDRRRLPFLEDHRIHGSVLVPGAAYVEMALAAGSEIFGHDVICEDIQFERALFVPDQSMPELQFVFDARDASFNICSSATRASEEWTHHASGKLRPSMNGRPAKVIAIDEVRAAAIRQLAKPEIYRKLAAMGLNYGPRHQGVERIWLGDGEAFGEIVAPDCITGTGEDYQDYYIHPAMLDAAFQVLIGAVLGRDEASAKSGVYVPISIERLRIKGRLGRRFMSHARISAWGPNDLEGEITLLDDDGIALIEIRGLRCRRLAGTRTDVIGDHFYEFQWHLKSLAGSAAWQPANAGAPALHVEQLRNRATQLSEAHDREKYYASIAPQLNGLARDYIVAAFTQLGFNFEPGLRIALAEFKSKFGVAVQYHALAARLIDMLVEHGVLRTDAKEIVVSARPEPIDGDLRRLELLQRYPDYSTELELMARCGARLADVLRGECDPLQLVYPQGDSTVVERLYRDAPSCVIYNEILRDVVAAAIARLPSDRPIRILEIGAGTGGLTSHILPILPASRVEYFFTDVSQLFAADATRTFSNYPYVQYRHLDIESDPIAQGWNGHSFDLILASDVLHATADLDSTLARVKSLLASNGLLALIELAHTPHWAELIFGLLKGWWLFSDTDVRPKHPWLPYGGWHSLLERQEFSGIAGLSDIDEAAGPVHSVIFASGPAVDHPMQVPKPSPVISGDSGCWLVFADKSGVAHDLGALLQARGDTAIMVYPGEVNYQIDGIEFDVALNDAPALAHVIDSVAAAKTPCKGIVHLWSLDTPASNGDSTADIEAAQILGCESVVHLAQALDRQARWDAPPRLWLATRGTQTVGGLTASCPAHAPMWGVGRVISNELHGLNCALIDLDPIDRGDDAAAILAELLANDGGAEVAIRSQGRYVNRLVRLPPRALEPPAVTTEEAQQPGAFQLEVVKPGSLDSLEARRIERPIPGPGEALIRVEAIGLNFRDVMKALGIYPAESDDPLWLGDECSGTIVALGEGVNDFRVGDDVLCIAPGCFGAFVTTPSAFAVHKPTAMSFEDAATIPITFLTGSFALNHLAVMAPGERILIHAAAGGVGLAAIQLAQQAGAEIFATAGSPEKRDYVKSLGVQHVMDSRSLDFGDEVMELTGGAGVDIVLNSLAGEAIAKGLSVLGDHGRFIEIGKRDIYQNRKLGLRPFKRNISFFAVDLAKAFRTRPAFIGAMFRDLMRHFKSGALRPLPRRVYPMHGVIDAFRRMQQARHIGKIVVSATGAPVTVAPVPRRDNLVSANATYLITGGYGGFGLTIAQWLVEQGARHLVLTGRTGNPSPDAQARIDQLRLTCPVDIVAADVADEAGMTALFADIAASRPPLKGIVHAAMVLDDGAIPQQTTSRMRAVMGPKVSGAWNLHHLTVEMPLDFFVLFSSVTSLVGNPGQANYVAANSFLDALAHHRHGLGLPALAINWGAIGEVGYVAQHDDIGRHLDRMGITAFAPSEALAIFEAALRSNRAQLGAARLDWQRIAAALPQFAASGRFTHLVQHATAPEAPDKAGDFAGRMQSTVATERPALLDGFLRERVATVSGASVSKLNFDLPIAELGIDSLMAVELETVIRAEIGIDPPAGLLLDPDVTVAELGRRLLEILAARAGANSNDGPKPDTDHAPPRDVVAA